MDAKSQRGAHVGLRGSAFAAGTLCVLALSFWWVWIVGHRGLFLLDESIAFDGAWRIAQGQVPYRDFFMPFGPLTFVLSGVIFHFLGADFSSLVLTAALASALVTALSLRLCWVLTARARALSLLGAALTAAWYQAPMGIPWMEQTAFLFDLLALVLVVEGRLRRAGSPAWLLWAGAASACAILSKQNAGGLFIPVCLGAACLPWRGLGTLRGVAFYLVGGLMIGALFAGWLIAYSNPETFLHYWGDVAARVGLARLDHERIVGALFLEPLTTSAVPVFVASSAIGLRVLCSAPLGATDEREFVRRAVGGWLALAIPQFHSFLQLTINNDAANNNAFVGISVACAWSLLVQKGNPFALDGVGAGVGWLASRRRLSTVGSAFLAVFCVYSIGDGMMIASRRSVHEFNGASFEANVRHPAAERLKWGEPTRIAPALCSLAAGFCGASPPGATNERRFDVLRRSDFESVALELQRRGENFFVFPDATILYGLSGRPSPQPLLYFHPEQSFAMAELAELDRTILASLLQNHVSVVVLEQNSFLGTHRLLSQFACLHAWIEAHFEPAREYGMFRLLAASEHGHSSRFALPTGCEPGDAQGGRSSAAVARGGSRLR